MAHTKRGVYLPGSSLAAALPAERRVLARRGWAGETSGLLNSLLALAGPFVTCQCLHSSGLEVASQYLAHLV
jgi:hypothetical protein